jgi:hypothetical protein
MLVGSILGWPEQLALMVQIAKDCHDIHTSRKRFKYSIMIVEGEKQTILDWNI